MCRCGHRGTLIIVFVHVLHVIVIVALIVCIAVSWSAVALIDLIYGVVVVDLLRSVDVAGR